MEAGDQKHDFEPGIAPDGLFWTIAVPAPAGAVSGASGNARFHMESLAIPDFGNFGNAISPHPNPPPVASHATFDVQWRATGERQTVRDETFGFVGDFFPSEATISFAVSNDGGPTWTSVAEGQTTVGSAVGRESNGVFFS